MSKSTIVIIFVIYVVSIIAIGFFGMAIKVYDKVKYIKSIEIKVEAESPKFFELKDNGKNGKGDNEYVLRINFYNHLVDPTSNKEYLPLSILPYVEYDSGDVASEEESIKFSINSSVDLEEAGYIKLENNGMLTCYNPDPNSGFGFFSFIINVSPEKSARNGANAKITVVVFENEI